VSQPVSFARKASVCKYVVPNGYPDHPQQGDVVTLPKNLPEEVTLFLSAVDVKDGELVATGSRTVAVVALASTIYEAETICERVVAAIPGPFFHRTDIGTPALIGRRVSHMKSVRPA
jgi:phosphoribosylamine-glycine ligase